jgi:hypothetical protein
LPTGTQYSFEVKNCTSLLIHYKSLYYSDPTKLARDLFSGEISGGKDGWRGGDPAKGAGGMAAAALAGGAALLGRGIGGGPAALASLGFRALQSRGPAGLASDTVKV